MGLHQEGGPGSVGRGQEQKGESRESRRGMEEVKEGAGAPGAVNGCSRWG